MKQVEEKGEKQTAHDDPANPVTEWARNVSQASGLSRAFKACGKLLLTKATRFTVNPEADHNEPRWGNALVLLQAPRLRS